MRSAGRQPSLAAVSSRFCAMLPMTISLRVWDGDLSVRVTARSPGLPARDTDGDRGSHGSARRRGADRSTARGGGTPRRRSLALDAMHSVTEIHRVAGTSFQTAWCPGHKGSRWMPSTPVAAVEYARRVAGPWF